MAFIIPALGVGLAVASGVAAFVAAKKYLDRELVPLIQVPPPAANQPPFVPDFEGGQCTGGLSEGYWIAITRYFNPNNGQEYVNPNPVPFGTARQVPVGVAVDDIRTYLNPPFTGINYFLSNGNVINDPLLPFGNSFGEERITNISYQLYLYDYAIDEIVPDECGDRPNPNPVIPINEDGGDIVFIGDDDEPEDGFDPVPLITGAAIVAALAAIAAAIKGVADSLSGIRKIGEALEKIAELLDKWDKDKNEEDKKKPDKRGFSLGEWYELPIDGGFGIKKITKGEKEYTPYQVQFQFKSFPSTTSRRVGVKSVSFANLEPIGWCMPRSVTLGFYEPVPIRYLNTIIPLPDDCDGFSFSFRENPDVEGKVRIIYSFDPELVD